MNGLGQVAGQEDWQAKDGIVMNQENLQRCSSCDCTVCICLCIISRAARPPRVCSARGVNDLIRSPTNILDIKFTAARNTNSKRCRYHVVPAMLRAETDVDRWH
jgi:hypothetical protein